MTKGREHLAERLSDVVSLVHVRRQTGLLSVERFENGHFEEGEIYFQDGQPILAHWGDLPHQAALSRLLSWGRVYFLFLKNVPLPQDTPTSPESANFRWSPVREIASPSSARLPSLPQLPAPLPLSGPGPINANGSDLSVLVPHRLVFEQHVLLLPLTRIQRSMYLLIDGHRTLADLARCMQKGVPEVYRIMQELRERNFVVF